MLSKKIIGGTAITLVIISISVALFFFILPLQERQVKEEYLKKIEVGEISKLPEPVYKSNTSVEEALLERRSIRTYSKENLTIEEVSQLLWAAQGITAPAWGGRTAPSAGATYPLELYLVVGDVTGLDKGVYKYIPDGHVIKKVMEGDIREELAVAALGQRWVRDAPINIVFTAVYERTTKRYGDRGIRYVHMEVGHAAQNVHLQAVSLNLGTVVVGAFRDDVVKKIMNIPEDPLYIMPVGRKV